MSSYQIDKNTSKKQIKKKIVSFTGLQMNPKLKNHANFVSVNEIIVVNPSLKEKVLKMQFNLAFRKMLRLVMMAMDEDGNEGHFEILLGEVEKMKRILKEKYEHELDVKEFSMMWKKACLLESDIKQILIHKMEKEELYYEEERGKSR